MRNIHKRSEERTAEWLMNKIYSLEYRMAKLEVKNKGICTVYMKTLKKNIKIAERDLLFLL